MTERFAVLMRFNEIRDNTALVIFGVAFFLLVGWSLVNAAPVSAPVKERAGMIYIALCMAIWLLWMMTLGMMP